MIPTSQCEVWVLFWDSTSEPLGKTFCGILQLLVGPVVRSHVTPERPPDGLLTTLFVALASDFLQCTSRTWQPFAHAQGLFKWLGF